MLWAFRFRFVVRLALRWLLLVLLSRLLRERLGPVVCWGPASENNGTLSFMMFVRQVAFGPNNLVPTAFGPNTLVPTEQSLQ